MSFVLLLSFTYLPTVGTGFLKCQKPHHPTNSVTALNVFNDQCNLVPVTITSHNFFEELTINLFKHQLSQ